MSDPELEEIQQEKDFNVKLINHFDWKIKCDQTTVLQFVQLNVNGVEKY